MWRRVPIVGTLLFAFAIVTGSAHAQPFNTYLSFDGTSGYVRVPNSPSLNPTTAFTFEGWFYNSGVPEGQSHCRSLIGKDFPTNYWIGSCSDKLRSYTKGSASAIDGGSLYVGRWNHFAVTFDGHRRKHYVNGDLTLDTVDEGPMTPNSSELRIGSDVSYDLAPYGYLDEIRFWNVARTQSEIQQNLNRIVTSGTGLVSVWHLDTNGADAVGTNHGTLVGGGVHPWSDAIAPCSSGDTTACLGSGRYAVKVEWRLSDGTTGVGHVVPGASADSALFWFFSPSNWELLAKALNGCGINNRKWLFSAATTNVGYTLVVTDTSAGITKRYVNPLNVNAPAVNDTDAFATCP